MPIYEGWIVDAHTGICELNVGSMQLGAHDVDFDFDSAGTVIEEVLESMSAGKAFVIAEVRQ